MTVLGTAVDRESDEYRANRAALLEQLAAVDVEHAKAVAGGGEKYVKRHHDRGKLLVRERIELLLDPGSYFLELSPLAAWGSDYPVGASVVTGVGVVEGVECLISGSDPTVRGGASNPLQDLLRDGVYATGGTAARGFMLDLPTGVSYSVTVVLGDVLTNVVRDQMQVAVTTGTGPTIGGLIGKPCSSSLDGSPAPGCGRSRASATHRRSPTRRPSSGESCASMAQAALRIRSPYRPCRPCRRRRPWAWRACLPAARTRPLRS